MSRRRPRVFAGINTNRTMFEMLACANEMAQRIAYDTRDWTDAAQRRTTLIGDGVTDGVHASRQLQAHAAHHQCVALDLDPDSR